MARTVNTCGILLNIVAIVKVVWLVNLPKETCLPTQCSCFVFSRLLAGSDHLLSSCDSQVPSAVEHLTNIQT